MRRIRTLYECEATTLVLESNNTGRVWEPLDVNVPLDAIPFCCYNSTIIFYAEAVGGRELARVAHHNLAHPSDVVVWLEGCYWSLHPGRVEPFRGRWCYVWQIAKTSRAAFEANAGHEAGRREWARRS